MDTPTLDQQSETREASVSTDHISIPALALAHARRTSHPTSSIAVEREMDQAVARVINSFGTNLSAFFAAVKKDMITERLSSR